jgi:predicted MFS family arabinose efflux permease
VLVRFLLLLLAGFVTAASIGKLVPHLNWLVETYGISLGLAGVLVSGVMLPGVLAGWRLGVLVDRVGARRIAIAALVLHALASLGYSLAGGFWTLLATRVIEGVGYILFVVAATVLVVAVSAPRRRGLALSVWSAYAPVGFALGQWASATVVGADRLAVIGQWHALALGISALVLALALPREAQGAPVVSGAASALRHAPAVRAAAAFGCSVGVLLAAVALAPLVLAASAKLTVAETARLTALAALPGILGRFASGWLLDRGLIPLTVFGAASILGAVCVVVGLLLPVPFGIALACFGLFQIAIGVLPGVLSAMLPAVSPSLAQLGTVSGLSMQMVTIGNLVGPPLVLSIYAASGAGAATAVLVAVVVASVALIANLTVFRTAQR